MEMSCDRLHMIRPGSEFSRRERFTNSTAHRVFGRVSLLSVLLRSCSSRHCQHSGVFDIKTILADPQVGYLGVGPNRQTRVKRSSP